MPALLAGEVGEASSGDRQGGRPKRGRLRTDQGSGKKKKSEVKKDLWVLMALLMKQILRSAQQGREMAGALFDVMMVKNTTAVVESMSRQTSLYDKEVKAKGKGHSLGPPYIWAYAGMIAGLITMDIGGSSKETLKEHLEEFGEWDVERKCELVQVCRCDAVYNENLRRITFMIRDPKVREVIIASFKQIKAERKQGKASRSNMEREIQSYLEAILGDE